VRISPTGEYELVEFVGAATDNFGIADGGLRSATSSDGGGDPNPGSLVINPGPDGAADISVQPLATKNGLQRTYRYTFFVEDQAGHEGTCTFVVRVK
jgi:hypothetical protein